MLRIKRTAGWYIFQLLSYIIWLFIFFALLFPLFLGGCAIISLCEPGGPVYLDTWLLHKFSSVSFCLDLIWKSMSTNSWTTITIVLRNRPGDTTWVCVCVCVCVFALNGFFTVFRPYQCHGSWLRFHMHTHRHTLALTLVFRSTAKPVLEVPLPF